MYGAPLRRRGWGWGGGGVGPTTLPLAARGTLSLPLSLLLLFFISIRELFDGACLFVSTEGRKLSADLFLQRSTVALAVGRELLVFK